METKTSEAAAGGRYPSWATERLRLGRTNVAFWVLTAIAVLVASPTLTEGGLGAQLAGWAVLVLAHAGLQLPFDIVGGYLQPLRHGRPAEDLGAWLRGVAVHTGISLALGGFALTIGSRIGTPGTVVVLLTAGGALLTFQQELTLAVLGRTTGPPNGAVLEGLRRAGIDPARVRVVDAEDPSFVGTWTGLPGAETLLVPERWSRLDRADLEWMLTRRDEARISGARARGWFSAWSFNAGGLLLVLAIVPGSGVTTASGLLTTSAAFTLWSVLGLLALPRPSRAAVFALDAAVMGRLEPGLDSAAATIRRLDRIQEPERPDGVEYIHHPVPCPRRRVAALRARTSDLSAPHHRLARTALFGGWAHFSWLARAACCNVGRPASWALPPGD